MIMSSYAQAISDNATIPVSVTLNTIMRLNVVSGGNIEFAFNTINDYELGIANSTRYTTRFTVASSDDFDVNLHAEDGNFIGNDDVGNTMPLNHVGFTVVDVNTIGATVNTGYHDLAATVNIVDEGPADDVGTNVFDLEWECGTGATTGGILLGAGIAPDRYSTNVFLVLSVD